MHNLTMAVETKTLL